MTVVSVVFLSCLAYPANAEEAAPQVSILELPFRIGAMRGPGSEVALAVATSGLVPTPRRPPPSADPKAPRQPDEPAPVAIVWGEDGGAVLSLVDGTIRVHPVARDAIETLAAGETPRGAVAGSHRVLSGGLSAYLTGAARSRSGAAGLAVSLTIRERQPLGVTADPRPVPVATATISPGPEALFAARRPFIATLDGKPVVLAVTARETPATSELAVIAKPDGANWRITAQGAPQAGARPEEAPLALGAVADFTGKGKPEVAAIREPDAAGVLQLWTLADGAVTLAGEAPGYAGAGAGEDADLASTVRTGKGGAPELALPVADRNALALVSLKDGIRERVRIALPGKAAFGVTALGSGTATRILVGLSDGRVAVVAPGIAP